MYEMKADASIEDHQDDLVFLGATMEAAHAKGLLSDEALGLIAKIDALVDEGDALIAQRRKEERASVKTEAKIRVGEGTQEDAVDALHNDSLGAAKQDRQQPVFKELFEGGVHALKKPALEAQNASVRALVGTLNKQDIFAGALRDTHVPLLTATINEADALLSERAGHKHSHDDRSRKALDWKQRGNALRGEVGGWLMQQAGARGQKARSYAREFFKR